MELIGALGLGTFVASLVVLAFQRKYQLEDRKFQETREAYAGLLKTIAARPTEPEALLVLQADFRYWVARALLVCPKDSFESIAELGPGGMNQLRAQRDVFVLMMRHDLERIK